ncbi:hypothetical protein [Myceligenerans halotolerans]
MVRSVRDRLAFLMEAELKYVLGLLGLAVGAFGALLDGPAWLYWGVLGLSLLLSAVIALAETLALKHRWSQWVMAPRRLPLVFDGDPAVPGLPVLIRSGEGSVAIDPELDRRLPDTPVVAEMRPDAFDLPPQLAGIKPYVLFRSAHGQWPFNGPNVRLATNLDAEWLAQRRPAVVQESDFFSLLCSNELTKWDITSPDGAFRFREEFLLDRDGDFRPLESSHLNNSIGTSTLAVTTDDHLVVTLQSTRSQASSGRLAPSGSGALEPRDLTAGASLQEFVIAGAERELAEETTIPRAAIAGSSVIGYGRWLDRGAKPEFFSVTALNVSSQDYSRKGMIHGLLREERLWTQTIDFTPLDLGAPARTGTSGGGSASGRSELSTVRSPCWGDVGLADLSGLPGEPSVPLDAALDALVRALRGDPDLLTRLRGGPARAGAARTGR